MKLNEIPREEYISLSFHLKGKYFEFKLQVYRNVEDYIITEPIRLNGTAVDLPAANIGVDITYHQPERMPVVWRLVRCKRCIIDGKVMYQFVATSDGVVSNRRENFRLDISLGGVVQIGENNGAMEVIVRDVSSSGFSFTCSKEIKDCLATVVRVVFFDAKFGGSFTICGTIVRTAKLKEDIILYGCHMTKEDQRLSRYIATKQMERFSTGKKNKHVDRLQLD